MVFLTHTTEQGPLGGMTMHEAARIAIARWQELGSQIFELPGFGRIDLVDHAVHGPLWSSLCTQSELMTR